MIAFILGVYDRVLDAPQPPFSFASFDFPGFALGVAILLGLEALRRWTALEKKNALQL